MNDVDLVVIAPHRWMAGSEQHELNTPYGTVGTQIRLLGPLRAAWVDTDVSPFAAIYAAKAAAATRVIELAPAAARNRLLERGDLLFPDDLVDRTQMPRYTFFAGKGYGFLAQRVPFCPDLRGALLAAAATRAPRIFGRGVYLATDDLHTVEPDWDADVVGGGVVPMSFLARELELCYAALCVVSDDESALPTFEWLEGLLVEALNHLPSERACVCATAMQQYRDRGDIGPDWRTWVAT
jgi:5'-methylthioadenosine phosphorylase